MESRTGAGSGSAAEEVADRLRGRDDAEMKTGTSLDEIFLDGDREQYVGALEAAFERVRTTRRPRLVSLEARSGLGKTRVVQEFFRRLAADQDYWAASLVKGGGRAQHSRKRLTPEVREEARGEPPFLWLAVDCD